MPLQLDNKVALITGSTSGIGRAIVRRFLAEGARVVGFDRTAPHDSDGFASDDEYISVQGDVRSADDNRRAVETAIEHFGGLDIFVGNAGLYDNRFAFSQFTPESLSAAFDELFSVNVKGYMLGAHAAMAALAQRRGCIIFTSSVSGAHAGFGGALYIAAKHAVNGLTKQLALELAPDVRVNAVAPGFVPTGLQGVGTTFGSKSAPRIAADMPLGVIGTADDYAGAYVFLASDACARTASGTVLALDGGTGVRGVGPFRKSM